MTGDRGRQVVRKVCGILKRNYGRHSPVARRSALEELFLGVLSDGFSERKAAASLNGLIGAFVDWNEVRVTPPCEIAASMPGLPDGVRKAGHIRQVLQKVYDLNNGPSLDFLRDKSPREAARMVSEIDGFPESAIARATLLSLGHDVMPLTPGALRVCRRIGLIGDGMDAAAMAHTIQKLVSKHNMYQFHRLLSRHAVDTCGPEDPACGKCAIRAECRTGRAMPDAPKASAGPARAVKTKKRSRK